MYRKRPIKLGEYYLFLVGGVLFIFAGAIIILSILFNDNVGFYITVLSILLITVFSILYSYFLYQKNDSSGA